MLRCLLWSLFVLFTLGLVDFDVEYEDGLHLHYESWWDDFVEWMKTKS
jgi:ABC-type antimicrobial peptide transport system permease subunit